MVVCTKVRGRETTLVKNTLAAEHGGEVKRGSPALFVCALCLPVTQLTMHETFSIREDRSDAWYGAVRAKQKKDRKMRMTSWPKTLWQELTDKNYVSRLTSSGVRRQGAARPHLLDMRDFASAAFALKNREEAEERCTMQCAGKVQSLSLASHLQWSGSSGACKPCCTWTCG